MDFLPNIHFKGEYRPYQKRILNQAITLLSKKKLHIVAAPGSGKTTLGIELILQANAPCLILTPSITIREQWIQRFQKDFLNDNECLNEYISSDLKIKAPIICITYQSLYSAYTKSLDTTDDNKTNDYSYFDLEKALKDYEIQTICLDECHHLRNEWWKALESIIKKIDNPTTIALTATPPYDSTQNEWKRYINLCGPINEEIFIPELVNDHNLCYHQDYIYYNLPTIEETKSLKKFYDNAQKVFEKYQHYQPLIDLFLENPVHKKYKIFRQKFFLNASYYRAIILFLHHNHIKIPTIIKISCDIEPFTINHLEILLQNILFEDEQSYLNQTLLTSIKKELVALRLINKRQVHLIQDERLDKMIIESKNKLNSIVNIVKMESQSLKKDLRLLILADYIKKESKSSINNLNKEPRSIGTLPIFEMLRRENIDYLKICLLTGSLIIIPLECISFLKEQLDPTIDFQYKIMNQSDYCELTYKSNNQKEIIQALTLLFEKGLFQVVIGTKALLGEGWDAPCVNTLILASFIGSYISSNQTRGRAIRYIKENPFKCSNIWHLMTINPFDNLKNPDYALLQKRFSSFLGIDLYKQQIESGLTRVIDKLPTNEQETNDENEKMLQLAKNRQKTIKQWKNSLNEIEDVDKVKNELIFDTNYFNHTFSFYNTLVQLILTLFLFFNTYEMFHFLKMNEVTEFILYMITSVVLMSYLVKLILRFNRLITKKKKFYYIAEALLFALKDINVITSLNVEIVVNRTKTNMSCFLKNASTYEQNMFNESFLQLYSYPDSPRYLLCRPKGIYRKEYYVVPDLFKKNKELATIYAKRMNQNFGYHKLYFAKSNHTQGIVLQTRKIYILRYKKLKIENKKSLSQK